MRAGVGMAIGELKYKFETYTSLWTVIPSEARDPGFRLQRDGVQARTQISRCARDDNPFGDTSGSLRHKPERLRLIPLP